MNNEQLLKWSERAVLKTPSPVVVSTDVAAVRWSTEGGGMPFIKNCTVSRIVVINHCEVFRCFLFSGVIPVTGISVIIKKLNKSEKCQKNHQLDLDEIT